MSSIEGLAKELQWLLGEKADEVGRESGFIKRERVIKGSSFVQGMVFGYLANPGASLAELSQGMTQAGTPLSRQGVAYRMNRAGAEFLRQMVAVAVGIVVEGKAQASELLQGFSGVYVRDSTMIELPLALAEVWQGCGGYAAGKLSASLKVVVEWELQRGGLAECELVHGRTHDQKGCANMAPLPEGSIVVQDLGFFSLRFFAQQSQAGGYWLSRYKTGVHLWLDPTTRLDLLTFLQAHCPEVGDHLDCVVQVGTTQRLPARLLAQRVPETVLSQRRERLTEAARVKQKPVSPLAWELAAWTILLTNAQPTRLTLSAALVLYELRWQIELLFKLWKSTLALDEWHSSKPDAILCELYAKLLSAILTHWLVLVGCWDHPAHSLVRATLTIRKKAWHLAASLAHFPDLMQALASLIFCLQHLPPVHRSRRRPRSFQRLQAFDVLS